MTWSNSAIHTYRRLIRSIRPYGWAFFLALLGTLLYSVVDASFVKYLKGVVDKGLVARDQEFIYWIPFVILLMFFVRGAASFLASYFMGFVGRSVVRDFRQQMLQHLMYLPTRFYDQNPSGSLISKINYDTEQVAEAITDAVTHSIRGAFTSVALVVVMFTINWRITLMLLTVTPILGWYIQKISKRMRQHSGKIQETMGQITHVAEEIISGHKVIRTFEGYEYEKGRIEEITTLNRKQEMRMIRTAASSVPAMQLIGATALSALIMFALVHPLGGKQTLLSPGDFVAMIGAMLQLLRPIKQIAIVNSTIQRGIAGAESIFTLLDEKPEPDDGTVALSRAKGNIVFQNVNFYYHHADHKALQDVSLEIKSGETIAFVGRSGSGKSTLVSLLLRFYELQKGSISIDGRNIRSIPLKDLRRQFAIVTQQIMLFNDTVANNIAYGHYNKVSHDEIVNAARLAHALEFIEKLPNGFETKIGENGNRLSGGQRQRLAIARAILKNAPILIFDEATAALDNESERHIQAALEDLMKDRTTIVIAHRLSTIERADRIVVMDQGKIVEMGDHKTLLGKSGYYTALQKAKETLITV